MGQVAWLVSRELDSAACRWSGRIGRIGVSPWRSQGARRRNRDCDRPEECRIRGKGEAIRASSRRLDVARSGSLPLTTVARGGEHLRRGRRLERVVVESATIRG